MCKQFIFLFLTSTIFLFSKLNAQSLNSIESVEYDPVNDQFLVSNGSSIIAQDYETGDLSFFGSGSATNGMEVIGENLYTIDGSTIKGYILSDASEIMSLNIAGAQFLNGLTSDKVSKLYATDFAKNQIIAIDLSDINNPSFEVLINNTQFTPNGIHFDSTNNRLVYVTWGNNASVRAVDLDDQTISVLATTSYGNMDGVVQDAEGNYYISTWSPARIIKFDSEFSNPAEEISLPTNLRNPADIGIAIDKNIIGIPHYPFSGDEVVYITLEEEGEVSIDKLDLDGSVSVEISPNPVLNEATILLQLLNSGKTNISLYDLSGKKVKTILNTNLAGGSHTISSNLSSLGAGQYYLEVHVDRVSRTYPLILR